MADTITTINDVPVLLCELAGPKIASEQDALDLIGAAMEAGTEWVVIPVERFDPAFFQLKTGLLGQVVQKFVTYRRLMAIYGDISPCLADSKAFKDFVYEANRGNQIWFVASLDELGERLRPIE
jgi:hypothetical protein